jgi:uncharacterized membrane protein YdjX (TVP38/TMEM64 family)
MKKSTAIRLAALGVLMVTLALLAKFTVLGDYLNYKYLSETLLRAGALGVVIYLAAYTGGVLMNLPAMLFTATALLVYGIPMGFPIAFVGSFVASFVHFQVVRSIGGQALAEVKIPLMQKIMSKFDSHPLLTVAVLRALFFISPPVNYLLALSNVRNRDLVLGTLLGILPQIAFHAMLIYFTRDWVLNAIQ